MRNILLLLSLLILSINISKAQIHPYGLPFIKNTSIKEYKAAGPNWAIVKDKRGLMYFANDEGVLEYDGVNWELIRLKAIARSLAIDSLGIIYVGGDNEFGFIQANDMGKLYYTSLSDSLNEDIKSFSEINSLFATDKGVFFCSKQRIYKYHQNKISTINLNEGGFINFYVNNTFYNGDWYNGLQEIKNDSIIPCKNGSFFSEKDIFGIIPYSDNELLISTGENTLYIYNTKNGNTQKPNFSDFSSCESLLQKSGLYVNSVTKTKKGYLINTLRNGIIITNNKFKIIEHYNKQSGLQDETVISNYYKYGNYIDPTWLGFYNGIAKIELNTVIRKIPENRGLSEEVNEIIRFNDELYFASITGVYKIQYNDSSNDYQFKVIDKTDQSQCWTFFNIEDQLIATSYGLFNITKPLVSVSKSNNHIYKLISYKNSVYSAEVNGLFEYSFDGNKFHRKNKIKDIKTEINDLNTDSYGNLWLKSNKNDLIKLTINQNDTIVKYIDEKEGLLKTQNIFFFKYSNKLYFSTDNELLIYNNETKKLVKETDLTANLHDILIDINDFVSDKSGSLYISKNINNFDEIIRIEKQENNKFYIDSITFKRLPQMIRKDIYPDKSGLVWISTSEGLYVYDPSSNAKPLDSYKTHIRKVINNDTAIFFGTYHTNGEVSVMQTKSFTPSFEFKDNSITFHYASTFYIEEKETEYYTYLKGFDKNWSKATKITFKEYTNLHEGDYTFNVKAKNIYGIESDIAEYSFTIYAPWYRTVVAYFMYILLFIILVWLLVKMNTRRLQKDKEHLEGIVLERTAEILQQKEEIENKNRHITSSIEYASRIQQALLPPQELIKKHLPNNFILFKPRDIVSGDFYWLKHINNYTIYATADCTGHGVPGAFMSMLGISFLNEIVTKDFINKPSEILNELRKKIKDSLRQTGKSNESKDGMDIAVCVIDNERMVLEYSGAYNPVYIIRNGELHEIKATRNPIGIFLKEIPFNNHEFKLEKEDIIYTFSDGYVDQFGGEKNTKFKTRNFKALLIEISNKPLEEQKEILDKTIIEWQGDAEQTDDIIILGIKM